MSNGIEKPLGYIVTNPTPLDAVYSKTKGTPTSPAAPWDSVSDAITAIGPNLFAGQQIYAKNDSGTPALHIYNGTTFEELTADATDIPNATLSAYGKVKIATNDEIRTGQFVSAGSANVVNVSQAGTVLQGEGTVIKFNGGPDSGISTDYNNAFGALIWGYGHSTNTGSLSFIGGSHNSNNSGDHTVISGSYNYSNTGKHAVIRGYSNSLNSGDYTTISGNNNDSNSGDSSVIRGAYNRYNTGAYATINHECEFSSSIIATEVITGVSVDSSTNTFTKANSFLKDGSLVIVDTSTVGLIKGTSYYVINATTNTFQLSTYYGGSPTNITSNSSNLKLIINPVNTGKHASISGYRNIGNSGGYANIIIPFPIQN